MGSIWEGCDAGLLQGISVSPKLIRHCVRGKSLAFWVNLVERFFRDITEERIRRGVFCSVDELKSAIMEYLEHHNADPKPYQWTAKPDAILTKVAKAKETLRTLH